MAAHGSQRRHHPQPVRLTYSVAKIPVGDDTADELELRTIEYNIATGGTCAKNRIDLVYRPWLRPHEATDPSLPGSSTGDPFAVWSVGGALHARTQLLDSVDILAHGDTCGTSDQRVQLRRYQFTYASDTDTGAPRLVASDLLGRQGTVEESQRLPIGRYEYGSATTNGELEMTEQTIAQPPGVDPSYGDALAVTLTTHGALDTTHRQHKTIQSLLDFTGDGRGDLVFSTYPNSRVIAAGENTSSGAAAGPKTDLSATPRALTSDLLGLGNSSEGRFTFGDRRGIQDTNIQLIDFNGDGRVDILKAENPDYWTLELNVPASEIDPAASPNEISWSERRIDVTRIREELNSHNLLYDPDGIIPLSRVFTGLQVDYSLEKSYVEYNDSEYQCVISDHISIAGGEVVGKAITAWALRDVNGDGYPDFVWLEFPVRRIRYDDGSSSDCDDGLIAKTCPSNKLQDPDDCRCTDRFDLGFTDRPEAGHSGEDVRYPAFWLPAAREPRLMVQLNRAGALLARSSSPFGPATALEGATGAVEEWDTTVELATTNWDTLIRRTTPAGSQSCQGPGETGAVNYDQPDYAEPEPETIGTDGPRDSPEITSSVMSQGLIDVNGDGLVDRVHSREAQLGTGTGFYGTLALPGMPSVSTGYSRACRPHADGTPASPDTTFADVRSGDYVDVTGDGIPDHVEGYDWKVKAYVVRPGTGAGWGREIRISKDVGLVSRETCGGNVRQGGRRDYRRRWRRATRPRRGER